MTKITREFESLLVDFVDLGLGYPSVVVYICSWRGSETHHNGNSKRTLILLLPKSSMSNCCCYRSRCHGLGYFGILLAMSWPRIFWDTFGNIMA